MQHLGVSASCTHTEAVGTIPRIMYFQRMISEYYAEEAGAYSCIKSVDVEDSYAKAFTDSIRSGEFCSGGIFLRELKSRMR